jgi:hypothetical protein
MATGGASANGDGGEGLIDAKNQKINVTAVLGDASLIARGGASTTLGSGGSGSIINAGDIDIVSSGAGGAYVEATGGAASNGSGGAASVRSTGTVRVKVEDTGTSAELVITSEDSSTANVKGQDAILDAGNLEITSAGTNGAIVIVTAGAAGGTANNKGGDVLVTVANDLTIRAADNKGAGGEAGLDLTAGAGAGTGAAGARTVDVGRDLTITAGSAGASAAGAEAGFDAENVTVGRTLSLASGRGAGGLAGADVKFEAFGTLTARFINLTNAVEANSGAVDFHAVTLDMAGNDTAISFSNTDAASTIIDNATLDNGHRLGISSANTTPGLALTSLLINPGGSGQLYVSDHRSLTLGAIDSRDATLVLELPHGFKDGDTFVEVTTLADFANGGQIGVAGDQMALARGDDVTLIAGPTNLQQTGVVGYQGPIMYTYSLDVDPVLGIGAHVENVQADPRWKSLSEGYLSGQAFLNQGTDLLSDYGVANALRAAAGSPSGPAFFSAISYGSSRYDTGSHIKVRGLSLLLGGAYGVSLDPGRLTVGAFFEYGSGSYDSYNDFSNFATVKGDGDTDYVGGGLLTRFDFNNHGSGAFYAELSARAGRLSTDFDTLDIPGFRVSYDLSAPYFGLHAGLGHVFNVGATTDLDLYAKYFWTHQGGKDFVAIEPISFGDVDSHRLRAGARLSQGITDQVKFFAGAAYENEFSGKAEASSHGFRFDVPELKGSTGIGELGLTVLPNERVNLDIGVQGYVGTRKGVSGSVRLNFDF